MNWLALSYSIPSQKRSSLRVTLWRRLQRIGAVAPKSGVYVLPDREDCREAFQWLAQEVQQTKGEAIVMKVEKFEGLNESELIETFRQERIKDYKQILLGIQRIRMSRQNRKQSLTISRSQEIEKLRRKLAAISEIDFFPSELSRQAGTELDELERKLSPLKADSSKAIPSLSVKDYKDKTWVTRPRPHVDRLASIWLIRQFLDEKAVIHYREKPEGDEIPFDMKGALLGHQWNLCSFETFIRAFGINDPALNPIAEIVHEIDLCDARYHRPETEGVAATLKGWLLLKLPDGELETRGMGLFEGLYEAFRKR